MLAASQEIDNFIERQRSKLNKQPGNRQTTFQQPVNVPPPRQQPVNLPPPPLRQQPSFPPSNIHDRLDFKVARILDEPPPRVQPQQQFYPPPQPPPFNNNLSAEQQQMNSFSEQQQHQQQRRSSYDNNDNNAATFFSRFGTYDDKRSQLKDDLKREYNEYLQSQKGVSKSKSSSQLLSPRANTTKHVQFQQQDGKVVAPWEKNGNKSVTNVQNMNNVSSTVTSHEYSVNRSRAPTSLHHDEQYIRDREEYILELHTQIRELEARRKQFEIDGNRLSAGGTSMVTRAHYTEDLNALNSLLAERLDQRTAVDHELARILNRPPVSSSPTRVVTGGVSNLNLSHQHSQQVSSQGYQQQNGRPVQTYRNDNQSGPNDNGFQIGRETDKESEQFAKKRYQQELQAQMREAQMRKVQAKQDKDEYEKKLDVDVQRYNYFGRSGGGAPMRDKDGNVVANLADVRNPPPPSQPPPPQQQNRQQQQQQQSYFPPDDKVYSLGNGLSTLTNPPFYNGEQQQQQQYSSNSDRPGSPNHARGAVNNGIFGTAKSDAQLVREEKYKQDLKRQMDEKRQRDVEETAKRRAEEERELTKHMEWQHQMEKQTTEDALRKQEKDGQERLHQQQLQEDMEQRKKQDEILAKRKPKRQDKPMTPKNDDDNRQNSYDEPPVAPRTDAAYRSSSPPVPTLKNKDKKPKSNTNNVRRPSVEEGNRQHPLPSFDHNDDYIPPADDTDGHGRQTYRKPPTPRQPDIATERKKPPQTYRPRPRQNSSSGAPIRNHSAASLRSDGSDSEVLNRLEHLKRQLKDREARLQEHVSRHQTTTHTTTTVDHSKSQRKQSPGFLINAARVHHRDSPTTNDVVRRILQTDDDGEFKPSYFRDDTILLGAAGKHDVHTDSEFFSSIKRIHSGNRKVTDDIEKEVTRNRYDHHPTKFYDEEDPTSMANFELNRIAKQNEQRLKKLRDLENDDASLLDSNEVLERFQQKQRLQRRGSQTTLQDDAWLK